MNELRYEALSRETDSVERTSVYWKSFVNFLCSDYVKAALSSEEIDGTVSSWPPKKKGDHKIEEKEIKVTRTNSGAEKPEDSEKVKVDTKFHHCF